MCRRLTELLRVDIDYDRDVSCPGRVRELLRCCSRLVDRSEPGVPVRRSLHDQLPTLSPAEPQQGCGSARGRERRFELCRGLIDQLLRGS